MLPVCSSIANRKSAFGNASPIQPVHAVEGGIFVTFGESGIIENGIYKVINLSAQGHHRLADVDQFAGALTDDVDAQHIAGLAVEEDLQHANVITDNLAARNFAVAGLADF